MRLLHSSSPLPSHPQSIQSNLTAPPYISAVKTLRQSLSALGRSLQNLFLSGHEPVIEEKRDRAGTLYWRVYDPITQNRRFFYSEDEIRVWLDQRYYQ